MKDKKKLGQEPAFPLQMEVIDRMPTLNINPLGISKRFYAACAAMQGLCATPEKGTFNTIEDFYERIVIHAYKLADELLKQENE